MNKPNDFWKPYIGRFWYFDVHYVSGAKYSFVSGLWQNSVTAPYCILQGLRAQIPPKHIRVPPFSMNVTQTPPHAHQTSPRHPPDISREQEMPTDDNEVLSVVLISSSTLVAIQSYFSSTVALGWVKKQKASFTGHNATWHNVRSFFPGAKY